MTHDEARELLETARPTGSTHEDPRVAEALRLAERDVELTRLLEGQRALDLAMSAGVRAIVVPAGLKDSILASRKIIRPHFWQDWHASAAAAAAILMLLLAVALLSRGTKGFNSFRKELITENWAGDPHLDFESSDLLKIRQWLARNDAASDFTLPAELSDTRLHGARVFESDGRKVSLVCLVDGARHLHLFVLDQPKFSDLPSGGVPDFEKCGLWKTASWRQGNKTYVLTGMNYPAFVSKFRKGGRWSFSG